MGIIERSIKVPPFIRSQNYFQLISKGDRISCPRAFVRGSSIELILNNFINESRVLESRSSICSFRETGIRFDLSSAAYSWNFKSSALAWGKNKNYFVYFGVGPSSQVISCFRSNGTLKQEFATHILEKKNKTRDVISRWEKKIVERVTNRVRKRKKKSNPPDVCNFLTPYPKKSNFLSFTLSLKLLIFPRPKYQSITPVLEW